MADNDFWEEQLRNWVEQSSNKNSARALPPKTMSEALNNRSKAKRMSLLPYPQRGADGDIDMTDWVAPQVAIDLIESAQLPGQVYRGEKAGTPEEARKMAVDVNFGSALLGKAPAGSLGMFAGRRAETANLEKMKIAQKMLDDGVERADVWKQTGWMRGPDGKMRFEIDDAKSGVISNPQPVSGGQSVRDIFTHPELYREYSGESAAKHRTLKAGLYRLRQRVDYLKDVRKNANKQGFEPFTVEMKAELDALPLKIKQTVNETADAGRKRTESIGGIYRGDHQGTSDGGSYSSGTVERIRVAANPETRPNEFRSVMLHELQHGIQQREGFARGGSNTGPYGAGELDEYTKLIFDDIKNLPANAGETKSALYQHARKLAERGKDSWYKRLAGEAEARNVQTRMDYSPEQRLDEPPWTTLDVPEADQIVRGATDGPQMNPGDPLSAAAALQKQYEDEQLLKFLETGA